MAFPERRPRPSSALGSSMEGNRRGTMQPSGDPFGNARTGIPFLAPPTAKPTPASRLRQSIIGTHNSQNIPSSATRPGSVAFGRTPLRRSSQWHGGRQSMLPSAATVLQHMKDTRSLREKSVQQAMRSSIYAFLQKTDFQHIIQKGTLVSPTAKDFRGIFEHVVRILDNDFRFGANNKKFEDEVVAVLEVLNYPFAGAIDRKWLAAPASMHSWPSLLGVLHWLCEFAKAQIYYLENDDNGLMDPGQVPEVMENARHENTMIFQLYEDSYGFFLSGSDEFAEQDQVLEDCFRRRDEIFQVRTDKYQQELEELMQEFNALQASEPPLRKLQEEKDSLQKDKGKFSSVIEHYEKKKRKAIEAIAKEQKELAAHNANLQKLLGEQDTLANVAKVQNLSPEEVAHMKNEEESLARNLEELRKKSTETSNSMRNHEVAWAKRTESTEQAVDDYTALLHELGLFPTVPPPLPSADLRIDINFAASDASELVRRVQDDRGVDVMRDIKPILDAIADFKRTQRQNLEDEDVDIENAYDQIASECDKFNEEVNEYDTKINRVLYEAEVTHEAAQQEGIVSKAEADRLETELALAKKSAYAVGLGVKQRRDALEIAFREQVVRTERLKGETVKKIIKSTSDIASWKGEVSNQLTRLRQYAEAN